MSEPFLGEIRRVAFSFAPQGWALCDGQLLPISTNQALYSLLGTVYGGDGRVTFALPDLRGRAAIHRSNQLPTGLTGGEADHMLTSAEMPAHTHPVTSASASVSADPQGGYWAPTAQPSFGSASSGLMGPAAISAAGASVTHSNESPYLVVNHIIALAGIFPSRD
jgi:microcystin-dependent protein